MFSSTHMWCWRDLLHFKTGQGEALEQLSLSLTQILPWLQPRAITAFQCDSTRRKREYYCHWRHSSPPSLFQLHILFRSLQGEHSNKSRMALASFRIAWYTMLQFQFFKNEWKATQPAFLLCQCPLGLTGKRKFCYHRNQSPFQFIFYALIFVEEESGSGFTKSFLSPELSFEALSTSCLSLQTEFFTSSTTVVCSFLPKPSFSSSCSDDSS